MECGIYSCFSIIYSSKYTLLDNFFLTMTTKLSFCWQGKVGPKIMFIFIKWKFVCRNFKYFSCLNFVSQKVKYSFRVELVFQYLNVSPSDEINKSKIGLQSDEKAIDIQMLCFNLNYLYYGIIIAAILFDPHDVTISNTWYWNIFTFIGHVFVVFDSWCQYG